MKKIISLFLTLSLVTPVYAVQDNIDKQAVDWMMETGISNGVAPNDYGEEYPATWAQVQTFCSRAFGSFNIACNPEQATIEKVCCFVLKDAHIIPWYSIFNYNEDVVWIAKNCGIIDMDTDPTCIASRLDVAKILYKVVNKKYKIPKMNFEIEVEEGYFKHELEIMNYLYEIHKLPKIVVDSYDSKLIIGDDICNDYMERTGVPAVGLYYPDDDTIVVEAPEYLLHEFGHFWDAHNGYFDDVYNCYMTESDALSHSRHREYCKTNRDEYYAEAFDHYIIHPDWLKQDCPKTYRMIEDSIYY